MILPVTLLLLLVAPACGAEEVRALHDVIPPGGVPPFFATGALGLLVVAFAVLRARRRQSLPGHPAIPVPCSLSEEVALLREGFLQGDFSAPDTCERLALLVQRAMLADGDPALTTEDVLRKAPAGAAPELPGRAEPLLRFCDRVRYGACLPEREELLEVLAAAHHLCGRVPR